MMIDGAFTNSFDATLSMALGLAWLAALSAAAAAMFHFRAGAATAGAQHRPHVGHYLRQSDGLNWIYREFNDLGDTVTLATIECSLALNEIYEGVEFPPLPVPGEQFPVPVRR